jgi:hypothetical protein
MPLPKHQLGPRQLYSPPITVNLPKPYFPSRLLPRIQLPTYSPHHPLIELLVEQIRQQQRELNTFQRQTLN